MDTDKRRTEINLTFISPEVFPVPAIRGGALQIWLENVLPHLPSGTTVLSPRDPCLPDLEQTNARHVRVGPNKIVMSFIRFLRRLPLVGGKLANVLGRWTHWRAVAKRLAPSDVFYVLNRPEFVRPLRKRFPEARIVLRLGNLHLEKGRALRAASHIDCCSDFVARRVRAANPDLASIGSIPEGVDTRTFRRLDSRERMDARRALGLADGPIVLFVGRTIAAKGAHILLESMVEVRSSVPDAVLVIVGSPAFGIQMTNAYDAKLTGLATELGQSVKRFGFVAPEDISQFFATADVLAAPALWEEPAGRVFSEAMSCGLPVVATRTGGIPETVGRAEAGILLDPPPTASELTAAIVRVLTDPDLAHEFSRRGRDFAEEELDWPVVARSVADLVDSTGSSLHG